MEKEGKDCTVLLLDGRKIHTQVQPKILARELLDRICAEIQLPEREYFGLLFRNEIGEEVWLQMDNPVMEQMPPKLVLWLTLSVRHFIDNVSQLHDSVTVVMFYLQARKLIQQGRLECTYDTICRLNALALQASQGDFISEEKVIEQVKRLQLLPAKICENGPTLKQLITKICSFYCQNYGWSRGEAILRFMSIVQDIPTYGIHFFKMQHETGKQIYVGVSLQGIGQFCYENREICDEFYHWMQLENLYFKDRKFIIEVRISRQNLDKNTHGKRDSGCYTTNQIWYGSSASRTRTLWLEAISQHQFYLSRKKTKATITKNPLEMANDLSHVKCSLSQGSLNSLDIDQNENINSLHGKTNVSTEPMINSALDHIKKSAATRKDALIQTLQNKIDLLRRLCLKEKEITGVVPEGSPYSFDCLEPLQIKDLENSLSIRQLELGSLKNDAAFLKKDINSQKALLDSVLKLRAATGNNTKWNNACDAFHNKGVEKLSELESKLRELENSKLNGLTSVSYDTQSLITAPFNSEDYTIDDSYAHDASSETRDKFDNGYSYGYGSHGRDHDHFHNIHNRLVPVAPKRFSSLNHINQRMQHHGRLRNKSLPNIFAQSDESVSVYEESSCNHPLMAHLRIENDDLNDIENPSIGTLSASLDNLRSGDTMYETYTFDRSIKAVENQSSNPHSNRSSGSVYDDGNLSTSGPSIGMQHPNNVNIGSKTLEYHNLCNATQATLV